MLTECLISGMLCNILYYSYIYFSRYNSISSNHFNGMRNVWFSPDYNMFGSIDIFTGQELVIS